MRKRRVTPRRNRLISRAPNVTSAETVSDRERRALLRYARTGRVYFELDGSHTGRSWGIVGVDFTLDMRTRRGAHGLHPRRHKAIYEDCWDNGLIVIGGRRLSEHQIYHQPVQLSDRGRALLGQKPLAKPIRPLRDPAWFTRPRKGPGRRPKRKEITVEEMLG
jgi:hypothetical protein